MAKLKSKIGGTTYSWKSDDIRDGEIKAITEVYGSKNLLENKLANTSSNGVDLVVNSDNSISASGKNNGTTSVIDLNDKIYLQPGIYTLSDGGYGSQFGGYVYIQLMVYGGSMACHTAAGDANFTVTSESTRYVAQLVISHSYTLNGTFYPMIRDSRISDSTYVPYTMTNKELTNAVKVGNNNRLVGIYTKVCTNPPYYVICLPYSERLYGPLTADMIDYLEISYVGGYRQNIVVDPTNDNILAVHSDDLPQDIQYVNAFCRVYLK